MSRAPDLFENGIVQVELAWRLNTLSFKRGYKMSREVYEKISKRLVFTIFRSHCDGSEKQIGILLSDTSKNIRETPEKNY